MTRAAAALASLVWALSACTGASTGASEGTRAHNVETDRPTTGAERPPAERGWLVWRADGEAVRAEVLDASGHTLRALDGPSVTAGDRVWELVLEQSDDQPLATCEDLYGEEAQGEASPPSRAERMRLTMRSGDEERELVPLYALGGGESELDQELSVLATLGPYVFVRSDVFEHSCGAHGNTFVGISAYDARTGVVIEPLLTAADRAHVESLLPRALAALSAMPSAEGAVSDARWGAAYPRFTPEGVRMAHVFTTDACYACSDGDFGSYTLATTLDDAPLVEALRPFGALPAGVVAWLAGAERGGASEIAAIAE